MAKKTLKPLFAGVDKDSCQQCGRPLSPEYTEDICPLCQEINLFNDVKEYIRDNDVNEVDVADHFGIPNRKVRQWIKDGRIQYKNAKDAITGVHCQICGKPLEFGNVCAECQHMQGLAIVAHAYEVDAGKMRFAGRDGEE